MAGFDYTLTGCANGHPVRITGAGAAPTRLRFASVEAPFTFDASVAHIVGVDVMAAVAGGLVAALDGPVVARCRVDVLAEGGADVGTIVAHATVERRRGRLAVIVQLAEARIAMEVGERLTAIGERVVTAGPQAGGVVLFSAASVSTSRGREWAVVASTQLVECDCCGQRRTLTLPETRVAAPRVAAPRAVAGRGRGRAAR